MNTQRHLSLSAVLALGLLAGYGIHVFAEGTPTQQPLFYSGTLEENNAPANGSYLIELSLYDAAIGGSELCTKQAQLDVHGGRFRFDISECASALQSKPDVWVAVWITGSDGVERAIGTRSKIGSVPYALEAQHAVSASNAAGKLATDLQALTKRVTDLENAALVKSAFQAIKHTEQSLNNDSQIIGFDSEAFDLGDEYDPATSTFTPKSNGYYEFSCTIAWSIPKMTATAQFEAAIVLNGAERVYNGFTTDGYATTRQVQAVIKLNAGDHVQCSALQETATQSLNVSADYISFEGRRFAAQ